MRKNEKRLRFVGKFVYCDMGFDDRHSLFKGSTRGDYY